jgi:hypothetical protein
MSLNYSDEFIYMQSNNWLNIPKMKRKHSGIRKQKIDGVKIQQLPENHMLANQYGLFATKQFNKFDIIGEYVGVVGFNNGKYVASINNEGLGIDAEKYGNELRFINDYHNIADNPNAIMSLCYIDSYPHIIIVCTNNISIGQEILIDYGDEYNNYYIHNKKL